MRLASAPRMTYHTEPSLFQVFDRDGAQCDAVWCRAAPDAP